MTPEPTTRAKLLALIQRDPELSLVQLAERLGVSRARAQQLLRAEGYEYEPYSAVGRWIRTAS